MLISILGAQTFSPGNWQHQFKVALGLDLSSGTQVVLKAATPGGAVPPALEMQASVGVLENRVNGTGNSGAQVQTQGSDQITVTVPGKAATSVVNLIDTTAKLAFRPVLLFEPYTGVSTAPAKANATGTPTPTPSGSASSTATPATSPTPSVSSAASATAKASTSDVSAKLAQPDRHPHQHGIGQGDDEHDGQGDRVTHRHRHPERQPWCHLRRDHHLR